MTCRPLFIVGLARSGTNLLARMLNCHPQVAIALDPLMPLFRSMRNAIMASASNKDVVRDFSTDTPFQDYYFDDSGYLRLDLVLASNCQELLPNDELILLRKSMTNRAALESSILASKMMNMAGEDYRGLLKSFLGIISETKPTASWVGSKEVWVLEFVPILKRMFPDAHFIYIERDPRAILASLLALAEKDPSQAAHPPSYLRHWRKHVALAHRFENDPEIAQSFLKISYESLVKNPKENAEQLCHQLGIEFHDEMLNLSADGWAGNSSFGDVTQNIYAQSLERWRTTLSPDIIEIADFMCGPEMSLTPYKPVTNPEPGKILRYLQQAGREPGSWRSDSGDLLQDFGGELVRLSLLRADQPVDVDVIRRCFLFEETYAEIRQ